MPVSPTPIPSRPSAASAGRPLLRAVGALLIALPLLAGTALAVVPAPSAQAAGAPTSTPAAPEPDRQSGSPSPGLGAPTEPAPGPTAPADPPAPTIDDVGGRTVNTFAIGGTAASGSSVRVLDPEVPSRSLCETTVPSSAAAPSGRWSCTVTVANGADIVLTARDTTHADLPDVSSASFAILGAPTVRGGLLLGAKVTGSAEPGAVVTVTTAAGASASGTADTAGEWSAVLDAGSFPSGRYSLTATQRSDAIPIPRSGASAAVVATIDREAPGAPVITSPGSGSRVDAQPVVVRGSGESGATVTVYVDGSPVCQATIAGASWSCDSTGSALPDGSRTITAAQVDAAGNYGPVSRSVTIVVGAIAPTDVPSASPGAPGVTPTPSRSPDGTTATPAPVPADDDPSATPVPGSVTPGDGGGGGAAVPPGGAAGGPGPVQNPTTGTWATATSFGRDLPGLTQTLGGPVWPSALALGLLFLVVVAGPIRMVARTLGARVRRPAPRLTGRNRAAELPTSFSGGSIDPRVSVGVALAVGCVAIAVAAGVDGQVQYARLLLGVVVGVLALNALAVVLPAVLIGRRAGLGVRIRMSPALLTAALVACAVTRVLSLDPPLVLGVLVTGALVTRTAASTAEHAAPAREPSTAVRGMVAAAQIGALLVVSFAAWAAHGWGGFGDGFLSQLLLEIATTMCLAGIGSLVLSILPLGTLPGQALWAWSKVAYGGVAMIGATAAALVLVGAPVAPGVWTTVAIATLAASVLTSVLMLRRRRRPLRVPPQGLEP